MKRWTVSLPNPDGYDIKPIDDTFHSPQEIVLAKDHDTEIERLHRDLESCRALAISLREEVNMLRGEQIL